MVSAHQLRHLHYIITDGYYSKQQFLRGVRALGLEQIGKLRLDANLRYLYQVPQRPGPGRPKTSDGKVDWDNLSRFEKVEFIPIKRQVPTEPVNPVLRCKCRNLLFLMGSEAW